MLLTNQKKKKTRDEIYVEKRTYSKFRDEKRIFQSSGTKNELHAKFKDENNNFAKK